MPRLSRLLLPLASFAAASITASGVWAVPVEVSNAAYAATYVRDCRSAAAVAAGSSLPDLCEASTVLNFGNTLKELQEQMVLGGTAAQTQATNPLGQAGGEATRSSIDVSGEAGVLTLKQGAFSGSPAARVSGHSLGLQSFAFTGTTGERRTVQSLLDFTSVGTLDPENNFLPDAGPGATAYAKTRVTVFSLTSGSFGFNADDGLEVQYSGFWEHATNRADFRLEGEVFSEDVTASGVLTSLSFQMEAGRHYYVESYLGLWARFGGVLDATHTFTSALGVTDNTGAFLATTEGLVAAAPLDTPVVLETSIGAVPEVGTFTAMALGLAALALVRRRRA